MITPHVFIIQPVSQKYSFESQKLKLKTKTENWILETLKKLMMETTKPNNYNHHSQIKHDPFPDHGTTTQPQTGWIRLLNAFHITFELYIPIFKKGFN
jgi:hypothetical protein